MNLTDLQLELRSIEEHIANLHSEIEKMKPRTEEEKKADFEQITKLAEKNPIKIISISEAAIETKKIIISSLSYMLLLDESDFYNRLLYLCRLAKGCGYDATAEDIYKSGLEFEMSDINNLCNTIAEYKYSYLVEALVIANYSKESSVEVLSLIADVAQLLDVSKEQLRVLGTTAKGVLMNDMDILLDIPVPSENMWGGKLNDYLSKKWLEKQREDCGLLCTKKYCKKDTNSQNIFDVWAVITAKNAASGQENTEYKEEVPCEIIKRVQTGTVVKKGDTVCTYKEKIPKKKEKNNDSYGTGFFGGMIRETMDETSQEYDLIETVIEAPCNGVAFFVEVKRTSEVKDKEDEYIAIYIVSYFDDYADFSAWYKLKCNSKIR